MCYLSILVFVLIFKELFLSSQMMKSLKLHRRAIQLRMGKSIRLQNRRKQVQRECACVGGICVYVYAFVALCLCAYAGDWVRVHFSVWGKLWQPGVFVLKFRQGSRWLFSIWLSKLANGKVRLRRHYYCFIKPSYSFSLSSQPFTVNEEYVATRTDESICYIHITLVCCHVCATCADSDWNSSFNKTNNQLKPHFKSTLSILSWNDCIIFYYWWIIFVI